MASARTLAISSARRFSLAAPRSQKLFAFLLQAKVGEVAQNHPFWIFLSGLFLTPHSPA